MSKLYTNTYIQMKLSNPGIGDSSFIHRDKALREGLEKFPDDSYELIVVKSKRFQICGGYKYILNIHSHYQEINNFIKKLQIKVVDKFDDEDDDLTNYVYLVTGQSFPSDVRTVYDNFNDALTQKKWLYNYIQDDDTDIEIMKVDPKSGTSFYIDDNGEMMGNEFTPKKIGF